MGRSKRNMRPRAAKEYLDFDLFETLEASTASTSTSISSAAAAFECFEGTAYFEDIPSFGEAEHFRSASCGVAAPLKTAGPFGASSSMEIEAGLDLSFGADVPAAAQPATHKYRGGRQKDAMVTPDERRKRDNHNQVERRRRQDIADKLSELQKHVKRPASTKKEIIMVALLQWQNNLDEIQRLESTLAGLEAMDSQYAL